MFKIKWSQKIQPHTFINLKPLTFFMVAQDEECDCQKYHSSTNATN